MATADARLAAQCFQCAQKALLVVIVFALGEHNANLPLLQVCTRARAVLWMMHEWA